MGGDLGHPFGPGSVVRAGHAGFAAESPDGSNDAVVVGGYDDAVGTFCHFGTLIDALDHGFPSQGNQRLSGEAARTESCRNNDHHVRRAHRGAFLHSSRETSTVSSPHTQGRHSSSKLSQWDSLALTKD